MFQFCRASDGGLASSVDDADDGESSSGVLDEVDSRYLDSDYDGPTDDGSMYAVSAATTRR